MNRKDEAEAVAYNCDDNLRDFKLLSSHFRLHKVFRGLEYFFMN